ncbi:MAG: sulfur transferase domain-containing protein [Vicinamibacterales bacterium]
MRTTRLWCLATAALCGLMSGTVTAQTVNKEQLPGIRNLSRLDSTVACAGAITPAAVAGIKALGYGAIINLRLATEPGADIEGHTAAATAAGIRYIHVPFSSANPDPAAVDAFLAAITSPGVEPAFIH